MEGSPDITVGTLLDGRVRYAQPRSGFRTGIEPVLLAASIPAQAGQRVLEAGTGAGAALLCLGARVAGLAGCGIERDAVSAGLARRNIADNGLPFEVLEADIAEASKLGRFDHVFANPPWHDPASTRAPDTRRDAAKRRGPATLEAWIDVLSSAVEPGGTVTMVVATTLAGELSALLHVAGLGRITFAPLWPRLGKEAKIVVIQASRQAGPSRITAGLVLHADDSGYSAEADAILRGGQPFTL